MIQGEYTTRDTTNDIMTPCIHQKQLLRSTK